MRSASDRSLEQIPEELVVDLVVILDLRSLHEGAKIARTAVRRRFLEVGIAALDVGADDFGDPLRLVEVIECGVDVVGQIAFGLAEIFDLGSFAVDACLEDGIKSEIRIGIRRDRTNFDAHALLVADGDADHGAAIHRRSFDLVRRFEMRIQAAVGVDAGIQNQADVVAVGQNAIQERPAEFAEFFFALGIPEQVLAILGDGNVGVHTAAVHPNHRLRQEAGGQTHFVGDLAANQFVKLDLVGGGDNFAVSIVNFKLRRRNFRVILFVLKTHGALDFGRTVNESAQGIARKRMVIASSVHVFKFLSLVIVTLRVRALEEETFNFVGRVKGVTLFLVEVFGVSLQDTADIAAVGRAVLIDNFAENEDFAAAEVVRRTPIKSRPIHTEAKITFTLRGEAADRGAVKGKIVPALDEEFLVVIEHVQTAFEVAE